MHHNGGFKKYVLLLEEVVVVEGAAHFINQEVPDKGAGRSLSGTIQAGRSFGSNRKMACFENLLS
ncbi:Alpha/beta hydrolase fold-1 [Artemisia annua]|uniref:Alpha/beta hydrolase fold-1 n=1 Tax=Artemisia annua TaxID=35608 RepID=A0A2U1LV65_ARTAN|nr:Alpha/beta hydrolase fold-1 [Artemisia annua]